MKQKSNAPAQRKMIELLYAKYYSLLVRIFLKTNYSLEDAKDAAGDFIVSFSEKMTDGRCVEGKLNDAYIKVSFKNYIKDMFAKNRPLCFSKMRWDNDCYSSRDSNSRIDLAGDDVADSRIFEQFETTTINACFQMMNPEEVNYVQLRFVKHMPNREIAKLKGQSASYVANKVTRAKAAFLKALQKIGFKKGDF